MYSVTKIISTRVLLLTCLLLSANKLFAATFPETIISLTSHVPAEMTKLFPKLEEYLTKTNTNYSGFTPVAYQCLDQLGNRLGRFWMIVFETTATDVSISNQVPLYEYVVCDQSGTVITDGGCSKRVFLIKVTNNLLCKLAINQQKNRAGDNRVGDWITITKVYLDNNNERAYIPDHKYYLLNYGGRLDWRDDGETPVEWYSIIYLADFQQTGSLQILVHRYDFGKRSSSGKVFSEEWYFYKLNPSSEIYELSSLSASDLTAFKERAVADPSVIGCEQYPSEYTDLKALNIVSPHLSPRD